MIGAAQFPHLDGLIETTTDQAVSRRRKSDRINAVFVAVFALETDNKLIGLNIPYADALVKRTGRDKLVVWRDGHGGDTILDGVIGNLRIRHEIPETHAAIATTRRNDLAISGKVKRVNILLVAGKLMLDFASRNIPHLIAYVSIAKTKLKGFTYSNDLVFCTRGELLAIGAEADAPDVQVAVLWQRCILKVSNGSSSLNIKNLRGAVATCGDEPTIQAKAHATDDTLVGKIVD